MKSVKFTSGYKSRRKKVEKPLGYQNKCKIFGQIMTVSKAMELYPRELFELVNNKNLILANVIYMNFIDIVKILDRPSYEQHRKPFKAPFVKRVSEKYNYEVDFTVRHVLQGVKFNTLVLQTSPGKPKVYRSLKTETSDELAEKSVTIRVKRKNSIYVVKEE